MLFLTKLKTNKTWRLNNDLQIKSVFYIKQASILNTDIRITEWCTILPLQERYTYTLLENCQNISTCYFFLYFSYKMSKES